jgi:predicted porin
MATTGQALNIQDNQAYVGATYDFGILKAYASWISRKATDTANSGNYQKRQAEQIGVRSFITPTVEGWASAGVGTFTPYGVNQNSAHFNAWQLGSNYWLSKRTNLYAIYGQYAQATTAYNIYTATTGAVAGTGQSSMNVSNFALGVRHTF